MKKYQKELMPELVDLLKNDTTRDWAANLLLYSITEKEALVLKYQAKNLAGWRVRGKLTEIKNWTAYPQQPTL